MMDEQTTKCLNDLINIVDKQNEAIFKLLEKLEFFERRLKALEKRSKK